MAKKPFELWGELEEGERLPANIAEIPTDRIRQNFQAGNLIFAHELGLCVEPRAERRGQHA